MQATQSEGEDARLRAVRAYALDRTPEQDFDELARLAAQVCAAPTAFVSVVDTDRVWFKALFGPALGDVAREDAFCSETIRGLDPLVVSDAREDASFSGR